MSLAAGIALFNQEEFYECHEVLEEIWLQDKTPDRLFYQGVIQIASGFFHAQEGRPRVAIQVLENGLAKLDCYPSLHYGINVDKLRKAVRVWIAAGEGAFPKIEQN